MTETQTAMLLTQREWEDLSVICSCYVALSLAWKKQPDTKRRLKLCERIVEAANAHL